MSNQVMRAKDILGKERVTVTMNGKGNLLAKQLASQIILVNEPCPGCHAPGTQIARANYEMVPSRILSVNPNQAKVQGTTVPIDAYAICLACGRRAKLVAVAGLWKELADSATVELDVTGISGDAEKLQVGPKAP